MKYELTNEELEIVLNSLDYSVRHMLGQAQTAAVTRQNAERIRELAQALRAARAASSG